MKKIAFTMREISATDCREYRDAISHDWLDYASKLQAIPFLIPNFEHNLEYYLKQIRPDLIILTGGNDIGNSTKRDKTEKKLIELAIDNYIPLLGICRGLQMINCFFGGKISEIHNHANKCHQVYLSGKFTDVYGYKTTVNSYHNFGIKRSDLGLNLDIMATDDNNMVEGVVHKNHFIAGIMWHPERPSKNQKDKNLIKQMLNSKTSPQ